VHRLLARPGARRLLAGQTVSLFGTWALVLVLGIWAKSVTGSNAAAGLVFFVFAFGRLAAPLGGLLADRVRRRPLMIASDLFTGGAVLLLLFVHGRGDAWLIYVVALLYALGGSVFDAARSALLRVLFPEELLGDANALLQTITQGLRLVAPLVGAGLFAVAGGGVVAVLDAVTFLVSAATLATLRVEEPEPERHEHRFVVEVSAGARHIVRTRPLLQMMLGAGTAMLVIGFAETLIFAVLDQGLHRPPSFFGVLSAFQGAGSILGGITAAAMLRRVGDVRLVGVGLALFAFGDGLFVLPTLPTVLLGFGIAGVGITWAIVAFVTALQVRTPLPIQGRVSAAADVGLTIPQTASIGVGAALSTIVDYRVLLVAMTAATALSAAYLLTRRAMMAPCAATA